MKDSKTPHLNRAQRRQLERQSPTVNGINFRKLTRTAYKTVAERLIGYGNKLSYPHLDALLFQASVFTLKAQGRLPGRHQITLAPGIGKSEGVVAWVIALHKCKLHKTGVAIAASKVEELCILKRKMIDGGVPAGMIGVWHDKDYNPEIAREYLEGQRDSLPDNCASEPSEGHDRQVLLLTHERIKQSVNGNTPRAMKRSKETQDRFSFYRGRRRSVIYDEALVKTKALAVPVYEFDIALYDLRRRYARRIKGSASLQRTVSFLQDTLDAAKDALKTGQEQYLTLPTGPVTIEDSNAFAAALPSNRSRSVQVLRSILGAVTNDLKLVPGIDGRAGLITFDIVIPEALNNVTILDASYPIRHLVKLDQGIVVAENDPKALKTIEEGSGLAIGKMDLKTVKRYDRLCINQMRIAGGRSAMESYFDEPVSKAKAKKEDNLVIKELIEVVTNRVRPDQSVLIFTFKDRGSYTFKSTIENALSAAGVDLSETVRVQSGWDKTAAQPICTDKPRINVVTWGMETALNDYAHCEHVILAGVIRRDRLELQGSVLGQAYESLDPQIDPREVSKVDLGEVTHAIYQALNRGSCRHTDTGQAAPMTAWIIHKNLNIREALSVVLPGAKWRRWEAVAAEVADTKTERISDKIVEWMRSMRLAKLTAQPPIEGGCLQSYAVNPSDEVDKISFMALRKALGMAKGQPNAVVDRTWANARKLAEERLRGLYRVEGRSFILDDADSYGFAA